MNSLCFGLAALAMVAAGCGSGAGDGSQTPLTESATVDPGPPVPAGSVEEARFDPAQATPTTTTTTSPTVATTRATTTLPPSMTIPLLAEGSAPEPQGGHPPHPEVGMIPRDLPYWDYPNCAPGPPWPWDCYPPSEWEVPQDLSDCVHSAYPDEGVGGICAGRRAGETPRWTRDVARWTSWCFDQPRGNCTWLLHEMKWALDYLGAHPWCVLNEYQDRADAYGAGARGTGVKNRHGWHNCATVIDRAGPTTPAFSCPTGRRWPSSAGSCFLPASNSKPACAAAPSSPNGSAATATPGPSGSRAAPAPRTGATATARPGLPRSGWSTTTPLPSATSPRPAEH